MQFRTRRRRKRGGLFRGFCRLPLRAAAPALPPLTWIVRIAEDFPRLTTTWKNGNHMSEEHKPDSERVVHGLWWAPQWPTRLAHSYVSSRTTSSWESIFPILRTPRFAKYILNCNIWRVGPVGQYWLLMVMRLTIIDVFLSRGPFWGLRLKLGTTSYNVTPFPSLGNVSLALPTHAVCRRRCLRQAFLIVPSRQALAHFPNPIGGQLVFRTALTELPWASPCVMLSASPIYGTFIARDPRWCRVQAARSFPRPYPGRQDGTGRDCDERCGQCRWSLGRSYCRDGGRRSQATGLPLRCQGDVVRCYLLQL